jgi:hypothetical protein
MDDLAKSLMEMPLDPPNVNPPANVEPSADAELSANVKPQSIVEPQAVDPAIESLDIEPPHVEWLPDTDNIERPNVEPLSNGKTSSGQMSSGHMSSGQTSSGDRKSSPRKSSCGHQSSLGGMYRKKGKEGFLYILPATQGRLETL